MSNAPARSLVKDINLCISQKRPRNAKKLALAVAQLFFDHLRVKPALLKQTPYVGVCERLGDLGIGGRAVRVEVVSNTAGEKEWLLHNAYDTGADEVAWY